MVSHQPAGAPGAGVASPLTAAQFIIVAMCLLGAVTVLQGRDAIPGRSKLQHALRANAYHTLTYHARHSDAWNRNSLIASLRGRPVLVVGDSTVMEWPWPADKLCLPGHTSPQITRCFDDIMGSRHYERIYLWTGSSHFALGGSVQDFVRSTRRLVRTAQAHADRVVLIAPMPYSESDFYHWLRCMDDADSFMLLWGETIQTDTTKAVGDALRELTYSLGDIPMYDTSAFRQWAFEQPDGTRYFTDGIHLSPDGFRVLKDGLNGLGVSPAT